MLSGGDSLIKESSYAGYEPLRAAYERTGLSPVIMGSTELETPIVAYCTGEDFGCTDGPSPVLVTAGAHAEEAAGVITALRLAQSPRFAGRLVIAPCRDPLGWDGVRRTFRRAVGRPDVAMKDHDEAVAAFYKHGDVIFDREGFVVAKVDGLAFCSFTPTHRGNGDTGEFVQAYLRAEGELAADLRGCRLLVPGSPALAQGRDVYDWGGGPTVYVDESGRVGNFNRFFSLEDPPAEVATLRDFARRVAPDFAFDLHENFGDRFGLYTNPRGWEPGRTVYEAMIDGVRAAGHPVMPLNELLPYLDVPAGALRELYPGVYTANSERRVPPDAFGVYVGQLGTVCFTTEMGLENHLGYRTDVTETALRAGLAAIERLQTEGSA